MLYRWLIRWLAPGYFELMEACAVFCYKVETGKARSVDSYRQMQKALRKAGYIKGEET